MCLPHCPTYSVYQSEAESPRGRISLIQAYARGTLEIDAKAFSHLDHCLGCMACEAMCPSKVPYGRLLNQTKSMLHETTPSFALRTILKANTRPGGVNRFRFISSLLKKSGLLNITRRLPARSIRSASRILASTDSISLDTYYPAPSAKGDVMLFTGCMSNTYEGHALISSIQLLNHYGFNVHVPGNQYCCGALHAHNGQIEQARILESQNINLIKSTASDFVIFTSNGCGSHLKSYASTFNAVDIASFLMEHASLNTDDFLPLTETVMVHESCSSQNKLRITGVSKKLLDYIPKIRLSVFNKPNQCCGAGGGHLISYPELADKLMVDKISHLQSGGVKYLVSDNLGCSLHFKSGLANMGLNIEVIHPVTLLARQLKTNIK